jgi:hypothetical protein
MIGRSRPKAEIASAGATLTNSPRDRRADPGAAQMSVYVDEITLEANSEAQTPFYSKARVTAASCRADWEVKWARRGRQVEENPYERYKTLKINMWSMSSAASATLSWSVNAGSAFRPLTSPRCSHRPRLARFQLLRGRKVK